MCTLTVNELAANDNFITKGALMTKTNSTSAVNSITTLNLNRSDRKFTAFSEQRLTGLSI